MQDGTSQNTNTVNQLIKIIVNKLEANRAVVERSIHHGRLSWRVGKKNGEIEVDLEPKL